MSSCAKETCIHSSVCMYYADRCTTNGDCGDFKPSQLKRPHGEWIDEGFYADNVGYHVYRCTYCNEHIVEYPSELGSYCKYCGSDNRPRMLDQAVDGGIRYRESIERRRRQ